MAETNENKQPVAPKYNPQEFIERADKLFIENMRAGGYAEFVAHMADLGGYSIRNQTLILSQNPEAVNVKPMSAWNYLRRSVVKGSESIKILAPVFGKTFEVDSDGVTHESDSPTATGYTMHFIFDVSQTQGHDFVPLITEDTAWVDHELVEAAIKGTLGKYTFAEGDVERDGTLSTATNTITLKAGLDTGSRLKALIHQVAAALVIGRNRDNLSGLSKSKLPNLTEIETNAAAFAVAKRLGLDAGKVVEPDFSKLSDEDIHRFAANVGLTNSVSQRMISAVENALSERETQRKLEASKTLITTEETSETTEKVRVKAQAEMVAE